MNVLITGTTNGIGKSLTKILLEKDFNVIGIDKKKNYSINNKNYSSYKLDITNDKKVFNFINFLKKKNKIPKIFILNAGINIYDNHVVFDLNQFKRCFNINFYGVLNFIDAIEKSKIRNKKILCVSSTSNIIPNPKALGYFSSKFLLKKNFDLLNFNKTNKYKSIVLGPVETRISRNMNKPKGVAGLVYKAIQISPKKAANIIFKFMLNNKKAIYVTYFSVLVYFIIKILIFFFPNIYMKNER